MNTQATKQQDEEYQDYTLVAAKDCDTGLSLELKETSLTYWIPKSTPALLGGFVPREGDIVRVYGKLEAIEYQEEIEVEGKKKKVTRKKTNMELVRGLDIVRISEDDENRKKRTRTELFYNAPAKPVETSPAA